MNFKNFFLIIFSFFIFFTNIKLYSQHTNDFVFKPSHNLINEEQSDKMTFSAGFDGVLAEYGFGLGGNSQYFLKDNLQIEFAMLITSIKSGLEIKDYYTGIVNNKINRVWQMPISLSLKYEPLYYTIEKTFRPFILLGVNMGYIMTTPYDKDFFQAFGEAKSYFKPGYVIGLGASFPTANDNFFTIYIKYHYIDIADLEIESIIDTPLKSAGGIMLGFSISTAWRE